MMLVLVIHATENKKQKFSPFLFHFVTCKICVMYISFERVVKYVEAENYPLHLKAKCICYYKNFSNSTLLFTSNSCKHTQELRPTKER